MKNTFSSVREKLIERYTIKDHKTVNTKSTDINVLLNRVKRDQKNENIKKIIFTAATSLGVILFGVLVF